ncbi:YcnI family protein [Paenibacillus flagellatus]|uniref:Nuclear export factor GLE1 n=1 Tax=Paenibacillus flagellatus TaxID=2211139 RepID=A0A2V5K1V0_9BACL|nr:YcnI family protein [Paenibacillus flagellatus]PYI53111.1 nuclear export factor GLE1 [Paenibacillus flagellatus]
MKKTGSLLAVCLFAMMLFAGVASAHVTVMPNETTQGKYEVFTLRVPTEKEIATVKVEVKIPAGVTISRLEPKPGWKYDLAKDASGKITGVVWTATGEGFGATEFGEFRMQGKVENDAKDLSWKAYQTYKDNSVVEWVGAEGSDKPASVTKVKAAAPGTADSHGGGHDTGAAPAAASDAAGGAGESKTPLYLSIAAVVLGVLSLIVALTKRAK